MQLFAVTYHYVHDMEARRTPWRDKHLAWLRAEAQAGRLVLAGACTKPVDRGLLIVRADGHGELRAWLLNDPYSAAGLIQSVDIREFAAVVGVGDSDRLPTGTSTP